MSKSLSKKQPTPATEGGGGDKPQSEEASKFTTKEDGSIWATVPAGKDKTRDVWVSGPLNVIGSGRSHSSDEWCLLIQFKDPDRVLHHEQISLEALTCDPRMVIARLARGGLAVNPRREGQELFCEFLRTRRPKRRIRAASRVGWHGDSYVFAEDSITQETDPVLYCGSDRADFRTKCAGTLDEWIMHVALKCRGNSRLILFICAAFASVLLKWLEEESAGFHLYGTTTGGKTTTLIVAGSAFGGGHPMGFVRSWRTTENGCELFARQHCDGLLPLDELAQIDPKQAQTVAYTILNGQPKNRMSGEFQRGGGEGWRVVVVSSGELTLGDHVATVGGQVRGGQVVRMLDVPADAKCGMGVFEDLHGAATPADFAREISSAARQYYGTPIRRFLQLFIADRDSQLDYARRLMDWFMSQLPQGLVAETLRAARRFALLAAAGELATSFAITGWHAGEAAQAARRCFDDWLANRGTSGSSDEDAAVRQVLKFIEGNGESRFHIESDLATGRLVHNRAGFARTNFTTREFEHLFLPEVFRTEVCKGFDPQLVLRGLKAKGLLRIQEQGRFTVKRRVDGMPGNQNYYAVVLGD